MQNRLRPYSKWWIRTTYRQILCSNNSRLFAFFPLCELPSIFLFSRLFILLSTSTCLTFSSSLYFLSVVLVSFLLDLPPVLILLPPLHSFHLFFLLHSLFIFVILPPFFFFFYLLPLSTPTLYPPSVLSFSSFLLLSTSSFPLSLSLSVVHCSFPISISCPIQPLSSTPSLHSACSFSLQGVERSHPGIGLLVATTTSWAKLFIAADQHDSHTIQAVCGRVFFLLFFFSGCCFYFCQETTAWTFLFKRKFFLLIQSQ